MKLTPPILFLAYDQGIEHGPADFTDKNIDPLKIISLAKKGKFDGLILQKGIAEKYQKEIKSSKVPLILKLNGKTNLYKGEPISRQLCSIEEAISLGASAVGYTIYFGSAHESTMLAEFEKIQEQAKKKKLPVILWSYPRGSSIKNRSKKELLAYSSRLALELGADAVKISWDGKTPGLDWAVKSAGRTLVLVAGGKKRSEKSFLSFIQKALSQGVHGFAIGRNLWQHPNPLELTKKVKSLLSSSNQF